jgi:serine/threonine protein kinase
MVHHDFHIGNILFMKDKVYISDIGLCRKIDDIDETSIYGVMPYVAPEVLKGKSYIQAADIYSFGMICMS